uniref:Hsp90 co-chaperone Cdc37 n=1 Tax=Oryzias melastigma TaxID=30732 RepID=A0A3B3CHW3_ORYME
MTTGIDYSAWDHIYVSDDEDITSPFVDTSSLFRMRHRVSRESCSSCGEEMKEGDADEEKETELKKVQSEVERLKKDEKSFQLLMEEHERDGKKLPWNVDTISKEGFSKSVLNISSSRKHGTLEEKVEKHKTFVEKYAEEIKHFGMLRRWDDSQKYLSDHPHLVCEETANYLVVICIDYEIDEVSADMREENKACQLEPA